MTEHDPSMPHRLLSSFDIITVAYTYIMLLLIGPISLHKEVVTMLR
jgi:hypothetical protein